VGYQLETALSRELSKHDDGCSGRIYATLFYGTSSASRLPKIVAPETASVRGPDPPAFNLRSHQSRDMFLAMFRADKLAQITAKEGDRRGSPSSLVIYVFSMPALMRPARKHNRRRFLRSCSLPRPSHSLMRSLTLSLSLSLPLAV
jgi:hypothetical protein